MLDIDRMYVRDKNSHSRDPHHRSAFFALFSEHNNSVPYPYQCDECLDDNSEVELQTVIYKTDIFHIHPPTLKKNL